MNNSLDSLRVLMLGWEDPAHIHGGLGVASAGLARSLGAHLDVSFGFPSNYPESGLPLPYRELRVPVTLPAYATGTTLYGPAFEQAWRRYATTVMAQGIRQQPDLIHAHDWMTFPAAGNLAMALDVPLVYHVHSTALDREESPGGLAWETEQHWLPKADLILTVSDRSARELVDHFQLDPERVHVLRHGRPELAPYRNQKPFRSPLVLFLGRMTWQKGPFHFLNMAFQLLEEGKDLRFVMAGEGDLWPEVLQQIARRGLGTRILAPGTLPQEEVFDLLSMADLLVMTSEAEPMGLVALEAAHFGVPMVLPPNCGAAELLTESIVIPPSDTESLCQAVNGLLENPKQCLEMVTRNHLSLEGLSWEAASQHLLDHYSRLMMNG